MTRNRILIQALLTALFAAGILSNVGCKSRGGQPSNPFAMDRQTAPPPATFSHQQLYMGQQPGAAYTPQIPATTYPTTVPTTTAPATTLPVTPLPSTTAPSASGTSSTGNGSIGSNGAVLFQTSMTTVPSNDPGVWTTSETVPASTATAVEIASLETAQTAWKNLETQHQTTAEFTPEGEIRTSVSQPENFVVSSSQMVTQIMDDPAPEAVTAEPKTLYAGQYQ